MQQSYSGVPNVLRILFLAVSTLVFLGVLTIGFIYEWKQGALEWD